jgi:UDP-N-acetylglucosamine 2-epimerase
LAAWVDWLDQLFSTYRPAAVLTFAHSDAALAAALVAKRQNRSHAHIESGLRHGQRADPQEIDRIVIDQLADLHLVLDTASAAALAHDGIAAAAVRVVGNLRTDALIRALDTLPDPATFAPALGVPQSYLSNAQGYALLSLQDAQWAHTRQALIDMLANAKRLSRILPVIWPMPRSVHGQMLRFGLSDSLRGARVACIPELSYAQSLALLKSATCLLTDRPNLQDASAYLGTPCLTLSAFCARPQTPPPGGHRVVGRDFRRIFQALGDILDGGRTLSHNPQGCDGNAAGRIVTALETWLLTEWENRVLETLEVQT